MPLCCRPGSIGVQAALVLLRLSAVTAGFGLVVTGLLLRRFDSCQDVAEQSLDVATLVILNQPPGAFHRQQVALGIEVVLDCEAHRVMEGLNSPQSVVFTTLAQGFSAYLGAGLDGTAQPVIGLAAGQAGAGDLGNFTDTLGGGVVLPLAGAFGFSPLHPPAQGVVGQFGFPAPGVALPGQFSGGVVGVVPSPHRRVVHGHLVTPLVVAEFGDVPLGVAGLQQVAQGIVGVGHRSPQGFGDLDDPAQDIDGAGFAFAPGAGDGGDQPVVGGLDADGLACRALGGHFDDPVQGVVTGLGPVDWFPLVI